MAAIVRSSTLIVSSLVILLTGFYQPILACTSLLVTRGASKDGSVFITYLADSHTLYGELKRIPAGRHRPGEMVEIYDGDTGKYLGRIPQARETYAVVGYMNEHQVAIGETTFGGRDGLEYMNGGIDYTSLMILALQRARSARQAISIMTELVETHGYASTGESFSIGDKHEAWILEMMPKGEGRKGALWVAARVPDGYVSAHANQARIRQFPLNDPENYLYSSDVIAFAREKGWFSGADKDFSFADAYAPIDFGARRFCEGRVWSVFRRVAPSLNLPLDWVMGRPGAEPMPLWIKPDEPVSVEKAMELMRDHFEGTELDMTRDAGAGPFALPYRWRPLTWKVDDAEYFNERAISTQQTAFSFVAQMRSSLPDPIGGVLWFGLDDTYSTVYVPMYCGIKDVPKSFRAGTGSFGKFSWDAAFWVFNFVANYAYSRYSDMIVDIRRLQGELESAYLAEQAETDKAALTLHTQSSELARDYLTAYSDKRGEETTARWKELGEFLLWKYLDGNVKDEYGVPKHPGYSETWRRRVADDTGERLKVIPDEEKPK
jgi:dipeptidase